MLIVQYGQVIPRSKAVDAQISNMLVANRVSGFEGEIWRETDPTSMLTGRSQISDTRSSPVEASRHSKFISNKLFN